MTSPARSARAELARSALDLPSKMRQASVGAWLLRWRAGDPDLAPLVVELDPTSFCDLACPECISTNLLNSERFSRSELLELSAELVDAGVRAVVLIGGGEPLMHPAIGEAIEILTSGGVQLGLTTNGTQLHRYPDAVARLSWTRVSVDAGSAAVYEAFRPARSGRSAFDQVVANIADLTRRSQGLVGFSFLAQARTAASATESNIGDLADAARLARDLGCDYFEVKPQYDLDHFLIARDDDALDELRLQLDRAHSYATDDFAVIAPVTLEDLLQGRPEQPKGYQTCAVADMRTLLTPSGAFLCPYHRGNDEAGYGDVRAGFLSTWWSASRRRAIDVIRPDTACRFHCIRHESNLLMHDFRRTGQLPDRIADFDPFI